MVKLKTALLVVATLSVFLGCSNNNDSKNIVPNNVSNVINSSGRNKNEFIKVLNHYKNSPLKLRATYFLIENMADQYHYEGNGMDSMKQTFAIMDSILRSGHGIFNKSWDSIEVLHPLPSLQTVHVVRDIDSIKGDFLIKNIDDAFIAWQYPWAKDLNFDEFCEYILPYKLVNENPDNWREKFKKRYSPIIDSSKSIPDAKDVCLAINKDLKKWFYVNARFGCKWNVNSGDLEKTHTGKCSEATQLAAYAMRAMGVPVTMDFCPFWGNKNFGHEWDALLYNGKAIHFVGSESDPGKEKLEFTREDWIRRKKPKVFRHTFKIQMESLAVQVEDLNMIPPLFRDRHILDVTSSYTPVDDVSLMLSDNKNSAKYAYIAVFNQKKWRPVFWGEVNFFNRVTFKNMGKEIVYLPMYFQSNQLIPAGNAFLLTKQGEIQFFSPDTSIKMKAFIEAKYPEDKRNKIIKGKRYELLYWNKEWVSLGERLATQASLTFTNVPINSVLWVRDVNGGDDERIFIIKNGKQVWL